MPKKSPKRVRRQNWAKLLRVPIGVPIGSWKVLIGTSTVPIGTNPKIDLDMFCLGQNSSDLTILGIKSDPTHVC